MVQKKVMIIDDDEDDRFFLKSALRKIFAIADCIEAKTGQEAFELLSKASELPSYIFLDINMPCMNGRDCLKKLKSDERFKNISVIMYSTSFTERTIKEFRELGASNHIQKPSDLKKLPEQILEVIGEQ